MSDHEQEGAADAAPVTTNKPRFRVVAARDLNPGDLRATANMLAVPTVHLNGTSGEVLNDQLMSTVQALHGAILAMANATPHARDFYPQGDGAFERAMTEHASRVRRVQDVMREYEQILDAVQSVEPTGTP